MTIAVALLVGAFVGWLGSTLVENFIKQSVPRPERQLDSPFRTLAELPAHVEQLSGPVTSCPECGAPPLQCSRCGAVRTDVVEGEEHCGYSDTSRPIGRYIKCAATTPLRFTHFTGPTDLCTSHKRRGVDFLRLRPCAEPGLHYHQQCQRCGWRGVSLVQNCQGANS